MSVIAIAAAALSFTGCVTTAAQPLKPEATHSAAAVPKADVTVTCAVISAIQTLASGALVERSLNKLNDEQSAAIINKIPPLITSIQQNPNAGLQGFVDKLAKSIPNSAPAFAGETFDPQAAAFAGSMDEISAACLTNKTETFEIATTPGG